MLVPPVRHPGYTPRRAAGLTGYERVLARAGFAQVAGIDEAGRGACAGPLVVAAVMLDPRRRSSIGDIADSKSLTAAAREEAYQQVMALAVSWHVVVIPPGDIDGTGLHVCNIAGMRRALAGLSPQPQYVLTDGFPVRGLGVPALAMWKGDEVAACVAAASVVAKVTRDRLMRDLHKRYPVYGFARHKGYSTPSHMRALTTYGPCPEHRRSFANVGCVGDTTSPGTDDPVDLETGDPAGLRAGYRVDLETGDPIGLRAGDGVGPDTGDAAGPGVGGVVRPDTGDPMDPETGDPMGLSVGDVVGLGADDALGPGTGEPMSLRNGHPPRVEAGDPMSLEN
jgi:ribonuclease HII